MAPRYCVCLCSLHPIYYPPSTLQKQIGATDAAKRRARPPTPSRPRRTKAPRNGPLSTRTKRHAHFTRFFTPNFFFSPSFLFRRTDLNRCIGTISIRPRACSVRQPAGGRSPCPGSYTSDPEPRPIRSDPIRWPSSQQSREAYWSRGVGGRIGERDKKEVTRRGATQRRSQPRGDTVLAREFPAHVSRVSCPAPGSFYGSSIRFRGTPPLPTRNPVWPANQKRAGSAERQRGAVLSHNNHHLLTWWRGVARRQARRT